MNISNPVYHELLDLGVVTPETVRLFHPRTRDAEIPVLIDEASGVIFLQDAATSNDYYESGKPVDRSGDDTLTVLLDGQVVRAPALPDDQRHFEMFAGQTADKRICDFGCGYGGFLRLNKGHAAERSGVELRENCKAQLRSIDPDIQIASQVGAFDRPFEVITMFHVLEHIPQQVAVLKEIRGQLDRAGTLIVEVPHANDFLISAGDLPAFRNFTFWSEHLVLHTETSLTKVLAAAGFAVSEVIRHQRYGFTNHLGWLLDGAPGGHERHAAMARPEFEAHYAGYLADLNATDTLIAVATPKA